MKVLLTGGLGFIFSHVAEVLNETHDVTIVDDLLDGSNEGLVKEFQEKGMHIVKANCKNLDSEIHLDSSYDFDIILHAAAESNVDKSISSTAPFIDNITSTINMLEVARKQKNLKSFIYVNTDEIHGSSKEYQDGSIIDPQNPYSASKAAGGHFVRAYANTHGVPTHEVRMCNVIGKRQDTTKLIPRVLELMEAGEPIPVYGDGFATREYIDVRDVAICFDRLLSWIEYGNNNLEKLHLITWNQELSILEVLVKISQTTGKSFKTKVASRAGHDHHYRMKPTEIMNDLATYPIRDTLTWMKNA